MLTLKEITLVKLVTQFRNDSDYRGRIYDITGEVKEKAFIKKISSSDIPKVLQGNIIALIKPIQSEVYNWLEDHDGIFTTEQEGSLKLCFNADGTVNRIKTADSLIHSKWLNLQTRFVLACQYWPSIDILAFFRKIYCVQRCRIRRKYSKLKENFNKHEKNAVQWIRQYKETFMLQFPSMKWCYCCYNWTYVSLQSRLLNDLPEEVYQSLLDKTFKEANELHVARFCLFRINADRREDVLKCFPLKVLRIYLLYPCHHFFLDAANKVWNRLPGNHFICLLHIIICQKILALWEDFDYVGLLRQFWHRSPDHLKQSVKGTHIFDVLMEIVKKGFQSKDVPPNFFLHANAYGNAFICETSMYEIINHQ
ncbi:uncharacterized protein TNCT_684691 [Trichonephila clavata]|uniref:Uncharacterized protein n=1 Tax=Trichonephila clavata TaxID=2740835 RepID=A0A8X6FV67_TRICU|nr:uncharacterized protein TNCT_684691 [Trichonephila clavata]